MWELQNLTEFELNIQVSLLYSLNTFDFFSLHQVSLFTNNWLPFFASDNIKHLFKHQISNKSKLWQMWQQKQMVKWALDKCIYKLLSFICNWLCVQLHTRTHTHTCSVYQQKKEAKWQKAQCVKQLCNEGNLYSDDVYEVQQHKQN